MNSALNDALGYLEARANRWWLALLLATSASIGLHAQAPAAPSPPIAPPPPPAQSAPAAPNKQTPPLGQPPEPQPPEPKQPSVPLRDPKQSTPPPTAGMPTLPPTGTTPAVPAQTAGQKPPNVGQGHPPVAVPATTQVARARVQVTLDPKSVEGDFQAGLLVSPEHPDQRIVPSVRILSPLPENLSGATSLDVEVSGLVPFGELTVPLMYKGRQVETLRFYKAGVIVRPPADGPIIAQEQEGKLLLVLENPSVDQHERIGVRVRFQDADVCTATSDQPTVIRTVPGDGTLGWRDSVRDWLYGMGDGLSGLWNWLPGNSTEPGDCSPASSWDPFTVRPSSQVSLWVPTRDSWFVERYSGLARSATRRGSLTLRYFSGTDVAAEQNVPLEVRFEPTSANLWWSIGWIGFLLLVGALLFLVLRVSIPNDRRKKIIKDSLNEARVATATISNAVDSQLRVLLRVERLALDQRRRAGWVLLPGFVELAARVEAGLVTLARKISLARRLDAAACRREALLAGPVAPTRLDIIDRDLTAACDGLMTDQLREADWLFIQQRLEAADKALNEPSPEEKQAFEALLSQRWQSIRDHFTLLPGQVPTTQALVVPAELQAMAACFPRASLLPRTDDEGGHNWVGSVGVVRADLQLAALERLRDVQFLAPTPLTQVWIDAITRLTGWLATPSISNLASARQLLQQLSEPATVDEIVSALKEGHAEIEMDPQAVGPNQTVKLSVRFLDPRLNSANLRDAVQCEWTFDEPTMSEPGAQARQDWPKLARAADMVARLITRRRPTMTPLAQTERGWVVHRYFESDVQEQKLTVRFFRHGLELDTLPIIDNPYQKTIKPTERSYDKKESREKWLRLGFQTLQMLAALLVPLATLAITTAGDGTSGRWWDLVGIGFGSEAIRNILTGDQSPPTT